MTLSFTQANVTERIRRKAWVKGNIAVLAEQLLAASQIFKEVFRGENASTSVNVADVEAILTDIMTKDTSILDQMPWKERPSRYGGVIDKVVDLTRERHPRYGS